MTSLNNYFKKRKDVVIKPFVQQLKDWGVKPDYITLLGFILGIAASFFIFTEPWIFLVLILLYFIADIFDGALARMIGQNNWLIDYGSDRIILLVMLLQCYLFLQDKFILIVLILYAIVQLLNIFLKRPYMYFNFEYIFYLMLFLGWYNFGFWFMLLLSVINMMIFFVLHKIEFFRNSY